MIMLREKGVLILALLAGLVLSTCAQQTSNFQPRTVAVNVRDRTGKFVGGLQPASFRAKLDGLPIKISSARIEDGPRRVVLLLDVSGSVEANHALEIAREIAGTIAMESPAQLHPALVVFSDHIIDSIDFSHPRSEIVSSIAKLEKGHGRTAILDALLYSAKLFGSSMPGDSVCIISDGGENASKTSLKEVERELILRGIRVFAFTFYMTRPTPYSYRLYAKPPEEINGPNLLWDLAETTGGKILDLGAPFKVTDSNRLLEVLSHGYDDMTRFYELDIQLPMNLEKEHRWSLEVLDGRGTKQKDVQVFYPQQLLPDSDILKRE